MGNKRIAIYSRKSRFVEGSESIENQIEVCKEHIKKTYKNVQAVSILIYEDEGFSGKNTNRPQYNKMIADAKKNKFDVLICYRLDRISRNVADFSNVVNLLQKHNIDFISVREQFDTSTPMGRAMMYIASVFAQLERETIAERVKDNLMELAKEGRWLGGREPTGYYRKGKGATCYLEINDDIEFVKLIYKKYLEYSSLNGVEKFLAREGYRNSKDKLIHKNTINKILQNPVYCIADEDFYNYASKHKMIICNSKDEFINNKDKGIMCYNKQDEATTNTIKKAKKEWIVAIGKHKGIIKSDMWIAIQNIIEENKNKSPRGGTAQQGILAGLIKCKKCGANMVVDSKYRNGVRKQHYYVCATKRVSKTICDIKNVIGLEADKMVLDFLKELGTDKKKTEKLYLGYKSSAENKDIDKDIKVTEKKIENIKENIKKLTVKLVEVENSIASKYIYEQIENYDKEIKELKNKIEELTEEKDSNNMNKINLEIVQSNIEYLVTNLNDLDIQEIKRLVKNIISVAIWDGENLKIKLRE